MLSAPLPQPAPFTCPHCGAAMESNAAPCLRCGQRNEQPRKGASWFRLILFLCHYLCQAMIGFGLIFIVFAFGPQFGKLPPISMLYEGVPLLVLGIIGFALCTWKLKRLS